MVSNTLNERRVKSDEYSFLSFSVDINAIRSLFLVVQEEHYYYNDLPVYAGNGLCHDRKTPNTIKCCNKFSFANVNVLITRGRKYFHRKWRQVFLIEILADFRSRVLKNVIDRFICCSSSNIRRIYFFFRLVLNFAFLRFPSSFSVYFPLRRPSRFSRESWAEPYSS